MKKILILGIVILTLVLGTGVVFAGDPLNITTSITPSSITVKPGDVVNLTALTNITSGQAKFVSDEWSSNVTNIVSADKAGNNSSYSSTADFSSAVEGNFYVSYTITLRRGESDNTATDDDQAEIIVDQGTIPIIVECPAAPAIAAHILQDKGVKGKKLGGYISQVAHEMGSWEADKNGSWFHGLDKCVMVDDVDTANPAYEAEVRNYVVKDLLHE